MRIHRRRFVIIFSVLVCAQLIPVAIFLYSRQSLKPEAWRFLEAQRPHVKITSEGVESTFSVVADGLNFALARRPIGAWESRSVRFFLFINTPAYLSAYGTFHALEASTEGTSKLHSDIATAVFALLALTQWVLISRLLSISRPFRPADAHS